MIRGIWGIGLTITFLALLTLVAAFRFPNSFLGQVELKTVEPEDVYGAEIEYGMVYVDTALTDEIVAEGYAKEVIRRIQEMRKQMQLDILDTIRVGVHVQDLRVAPLLQEWKEHIASEVRASTLDIGNSTQAHGTLVKEWDVDGVVMAIGVSRDE